MDAINRYSRTTVHFHLGFVIAMPWAMDKAKSVDFQKSVLEHGLDFEQTNMTGNVFTLGRNQPWHLFVRINSPGPQICEIQITSANPQCDISMFARDAQAVCDAFQETFPAKRYQLVRTNSKIQHIYSCKDHAFKYIWENRLGQSPQDFQALGARPVAGGGIRLVMPPHGQGDEAKHAIELKIESFIRQPQNMMIETLFTWPEPSVLEAEQKFDTTALLNKVEDYAANQVWEFLTQSKA